MMKVNCVKNIEKCRICNESSESAENGHLHSLAKHLYIIIV